MIELFKYQFFTNAFLATIFIAVTTGIIGSYIVSKRMVFISGGLTHASFGGIGIAYYLGLEPMLGATFFAVLSGLGIEFLPNKTDVRQDSVIGILWSFGMALGIIFIYLTPGYAPNLMSYLFGNILTITSSELWMMFLLATIVCVFFYIFYKPILFISFDENYAKTHRIPVKILNYLIITLASLTIVLSIRVVGIVLIISLLTIPPTIANLFSNSLNKIMLISIFVGIIGGLGGLFLSYFIEIPSGASIIFVLVVLFILMKTIQIIKKKSKIKNQLNT